MEQAYPGMQRFRGFAVGCFVDKDFPPPQAELQRQYRHHWLPEIPGLPGSEAFGDADEVKGG